MKANGGGGGGGRVGSIGSKVADSVFTSYSYRTRPFAKLFTKKRSVQMLSYFNLLHFQSYQFITNQTMSHN